MKRSIIKIKRHSALDAESPIGRRLRVKPAMTSLLVVFLVLISSCKEDFIGQYPIDDVPPKAVSNVLVENRTGSARITYQLPDETDLLYVKAVYRLSNGQEMETKTSVYSNSMLLEGFGRKAKHSIRLIAVDNSRNESEAVQVEIEPEDSPIYEIRKTITVAPGFGGVKVSWQNPEKHYAIVGVMKWEDNTYKTLEKYYSSEADANRAVRGQEAKESEFAIYVTDLYSNLTDTLNVSLTPWFEEKLDKSKFTALTKSAKFTVSPYGTSNMGCVWDDVINDVTKNGIYYYQANDEGYQPYFQFDLGAKAKLSRFRVWSRADYYFQLHAPKRVAIFGTNNETAAKNPESADSEWTLLLTGNSYRPSGFGPDVPPTDEDRIYAEAGEEYEFSLETPSVRYIRFKQLEGWTGTNAMTICELTFWGNTKISE